MRTKRLELEALTRDELMSLHKGDLDPFNRNEEWPSSALIDALPHFINDMMDDPDSYGWNVWVIRSEGVIIGDCGFKSRPDEEGSVEIGFSISSENRGNGYAFEALRSLIDWGYQNGVIEVLSEVHVENRSSIRTMEKLGFKEFERVKDHIYFKLNKNDRICCAKL